MKFNTTSYHLLFCVMVIFFPSLAFAPWSIRYPPKPPRDDIQRTCAQWIVHHGFTMDNYDLNIYLSLHRNSVLDKYASTFAAIYAFKTQFMRYPDTLLPNEFCQSIGTENNNVYPYKALKNESRSCEGWISLYVFQNDYNILHFFYDKGPDSDFVDIFEMEEISIWAYSYFSHLLTWRGIRDIIEPSVYCAQIGKKVGQDAISMPFMNVNDTSLTCKAWLELFEFSNDLGNNYDKAKYLEENQLYNGIFLPYMPRLYSYYLQDMEFSDIRRRNMTPWGFCRSYVNNDVTVEYDYNYERINN